jgi:hypothetical protein
MKDKLRKIACGRKLAQRLMSGVGVCPVVVLAQIAALDDEPRFRRVTDVGAFLGLTPQEYKSAHTDRSGHISKCRDRLSKHSSSASNSTMTALAVGPFSAPNDAGFYQLLTHSHALPAIDLAFVNSNPPQRLQPTACKSRAPQSFDYVRTFTHQPPQ